MKSLVITMLILASTRAFAGEADVLAAEAQRSGESRYRFTVTVRHADSGWDHYADRWDLVGPDGTVLATRTLLHPHVDEQPFTRSLGDVQIPGDIGLVTIRAHDSRHGYGGKSLPLTLPQ